MTDKTKVRRPVYFDLLEIKEIDKALRTCSESSFSSKARREMLAWARKINEREAVRQNIMAVANA